MADRFRVSPGLRPLLTPLAELRPHPDNVRVHGERDLAVLMGLLSRYGCYHALQATADGTVFIGNGRLLAAQRLGWTHLPVERHAACLACEGAGCVECEGTGQLTSVMVLRLALADNRSAELSGWNLQVVGTTLQRLASDGENLDGLGWSEMERAPLLGADWNPPQAREQEGVAHWAARAVKFEGDTWRVVEQAVVALRESRQDPDLSASACVVAICETYLGEVDA